jgi:hypothetical protein
VQYSAIAPKAHLSNNSEYRLTSIGENEDSLFFDFTYVDTASFNLLGYFKASKAILVYSKTSLSPLDSFFYFDYNQQKEMRAISTGGTRPLYFDLDYTLFPGPPKTAHQVISIRDWQRDSLSTINFFSSYNYGQSYFYTFGMISPSGSHPWFSKFLNIEKEIAPEVDISLYPNPSNGKLTLANYSRGFENLIITIFDIQGKFIGSNIKPDFNGNLHLPSELSNGMYYLKVQGRDQTTKTFKVLLSR